MSDILKVTNIPNSKNLKLEHDDLRKVLTTRWNSVEIHPRDITMITNAIPLEWEQEKHIIEITVYNSTTFALTFVNEKAANDAYRLLDSFIPQE